MWSTRRPRRRALGGATTLVVCLLSVGLGACATRTRAAKQPSSSGLAAYIGKVRKLSAEARPRSSGTAVTLESWDPRLSAALTMLALVENGETHRRVGLAYMRQGVLDKAHAHLTRAVEFDPQDAAAFDLLARIWRLWGAPELGLDDARKAVDLAPDSPVAANTLGSLFAALGRMRDAQRWYARALLLDPGAAYALSNLCYTATMMGDPGAAVGACQRALALSPDSIVAHNNLALAYAVEGDLTQAREEFAHGGAAAAHYNMGILYMAKRQYRKAADSFDAALLAKPGFAMAAARSRQARRFDAVARAQGQGGTDGESIVIPDRSVEPSDGHSKAGS
jgi:tetratricopeptide (TPR) repeat protein